MSVPGQAELIAGRFEVRGSRREALEARKRFLWRDAGGLREQEQAPTALLAKSAAALWVPGVDRETGAPVLIAPRSARSWVADLHEEAIGRHVMAARLPCFVPVLHAGPEVVFADPGPAPPRPALPLATAACCALDVCEATAWLHATGCAGEEGRLCFDPIHLRVLPEGERWRIQWLLPGMPEVERMFRAKQLDSFLEWCSMADELEPVALDVLRIVDFFFELCPPALASAPAEEAHPMRAAALRTLRRARGGVAAARPAHVALLARLLSQLAEPSAERAARIAALPAITAPAPLAHDWDAVLADGEALLAADQGSVLLPLAAAYHQRASRAFARGAPDAALPDVERALALDAWFHYRTTRAVILDALGQREESRRAITLAIAEAAALEQQNERDVAAWLNDLRYRKTPEEIARIEAHLRRDRSFSDAELARVHAVRGMFALRDGAPAEAARDLERAMALSPTALTAHTLGAARYALGDLEGAAQAEARSIEIDPGCARYRWALVITLRKLGMHDEAREHAAHILERWPEAPEHRERFTRLFGG